MKFLEGCDVRLATGVQVLLAIMTWKHEYLTGTFYHCGMAAI